MKKAILTLLPFSSLLLIAGCGNPPPAPATTYTIKFANWDGQILQETQVEENTYPVFKEETPSKPAKTNYQNIFTGWGEITKATEDKTYTAQYDNVYLFGTYPQTLVSDDELIKKLEGEDPSGDYGYITYENKQYYKYVSENNYIADDGTEVKIGDTNYYVVDQIQWKLLKNDDTKDRPDFCTTYKLLKAQMYANRPQPGQSVNGRTKFNQYQYSTLNEWLTTSTAPDLTTDLGGFAWRAFTTSDYGKIAETTIDNTLKSTDDNENPFVSPDEQKAKVFELSRRNLHGHEDNDSTEKLPFAEGDLDDINRTALVTDFAKATGSSSGKYGEYWTRSPSYIDWMPTDDVYAYQVMTTGHVIWHNIDDKTVCARPTIRFNN